MLALAGWLGKFEVGRIFIARLGRAAALTLHFSAVAD
jgi:hypothetical protein